MDEKSEKNRDFNSIFHKYELFQQALFVSQEKAKILYDNVKIATNSALNETVRENANSIIQSSKDIYKMVTQNVKTLKDEFKAKKSEILINKG